jgi:hypothetical protein
MSALSVKLQSLPALLLSVFALAGCAVGPDYAPPSVQMSSAFKGAAAINDRAGAPTPDLAHWWTGFNDPALNRVVATALAQNLTLAQATARVAQARATTRSARAALLPTGQMNVQAAAAHQSLEDPLGRVENSQPGFDRNSRLYQASAGVSWEVDVFGGLRRSAEAAQADYEAAQASSVAARLSSKRRRKTGASIWRSFGIRGVSHQSWNCVRRKENLLRPAPTFQFSKQPSYPRVTGSTF